MTNDQRGQDEKFLTYLIMVLGLGVFVAICVRLILEGIKYREECKFFIMSIIMSLSTISMLDYGWSPRPPKRWVRYMVWSVITISGIVIPAATVAIRLILKF